MQACALRCAPAPLTGDDLILIHRAAHGAHQDRLDDAALADRRREFIEFGLREGAARIARIRFEKLDRHAALAARAFEHGGFIADIADQCGKPAAEPRSFVVCHCRLLCHVRSVVLVCHGRDFMRGDNASHLLPASDDTNYYAARSILSR